MLGRVLLGRLVPPSEREGRKLVQDSFPAPFPAGSRVTRRQRSGKRCRKVFPCKTAQNRLRLEVHWGTGVVVTRRSPKPQLQVRFLGPPLLRMAANARNHQCLRRICPAWSERRDPHEPAWCCSSLLVAHAGSNEVRLPSRCDVDIRDMSE